MRAQRIEDRVVFRDPHGYAAHPHLIRAGGDLLLVFNWAPRRAVILHPPQDPMYVNLLTRSGDEGRTWSPPVVAPDYGWAGVECAGLTDLGGGRVMLNQWRFRWHPLPAAEQHPDRSHLTFPAELAQGLLASPDLDLDPELAPEPERLMPWARGPGAAHVHLSEDGGHTFQHHAALDTTPFAGGYGMRGGVALPDGSLLLPLSDVPRYEQVFVLRSEDGGRSWSRSSPVAVLPGRAFEEPAPLVLPDGTVLLLLRENVSRSLWQTRSSDGGETWAEPAPAGIDGYPGHLLRLPEGRLLCTYGHRKPPYGIRVSLSEDDGRTWRPSAAIRDDLPNRNLGYPCTALCADGSLLTIFYGEDATGVTVIAASRWQLRG